MRFTSLPSLITLLILFAISSHSLASLAENREGFFQAVRTATPPTIDGNINEAVWHNANIATDFHQHEPHNDRPASHETEVRVLYDDEAIYIAAKMFDPVPDSILFEMGPRDSGNDINADRFYVDINPFNDGINGFRFQVSASGVQTDGNLVGGHMGRGDTNWDAVWESAVGLTENGWVVEIKIPYSALRFPKGDLQEWGINFWREIRRSRETSSWNFVDRRVGDNQAFMGVMNGITDIRPPLRLAFYPYMSNYVEKNGFESGWANSFNGGVDVKLGISPSFTMDVTLIPDFGQVQSDAKVLNLSPYEVKYDENRQFFTEGTDLFGKADLFYSRRVGARPRGYSSTSRERKEEEVVYKNPIETRMINATKVSGRTSSGLGIGFFNAMTAASYGTLKDTITGETREVETQPFTNYNLVVVDQNLRNNSYISLINTNVSGSEEGYAANVTGTDFRFLDSSNMFRISGSGAVSQQYYADSENNFGYKYNLGLGKYGGTWQYNYSRSVITDDYDQNDMGFLRRNNRIDDSFSFSHNIFEPFSYFLSLNSSLGFNYSRLYEPNNFTGMRWTYHMRMLFRSRLHLMVRSSYSPRGERDYFEPRARGRMYRTHENYNVHISYSSDYRRRVYWDGHFSYGTTTSASKGIGRGVKVKPTLRVNDRMTMSYGFEYNDNRNDIGYVRHHHVDSVYFGRRNTPTLTNTFNTGYIFNNNLSLDFNLRHYWSKVEYDGQYYFLQQDGNLSSIDQDLQAANINYNAFTIDLLLTWHFAPGSQMSLAYKNIIDNRHAHLYDSYLDNVRDMFDRPQVNSLSIKLLYYLDYQSIQRLSRR